ncbi:MAG: family 20 glycosylhydrolase [Bacteroidales bacterium]|nr:family 20 glycosylhydrolase [Bacteroidales bacterium]
MKMFRIFIVGALFALAFFGSCSVTSDEELALIPKPQEIDLGRGFFAIDSTTLLISDLPDEQTEPIIVRLENMLGWPVKSISTDQLKPDSDANYILLQSDYPSIEKEAYELVIAKSKISLNAGTYEGLCNALATLNQIITFSDKLSSGVYSVPVLSIHDVPQYEWRGLMLDCSRTFIPPAELRKYIDQLAFYKMNILHLHLTDDQGWRLEIKKYPELTSVSSKFAPQYVNQKGGFYSQDEMKELIRYAASKNITIIPEIEMPGHSSEIFAAYPGLSCRGERTEIYPFFSGPGITSDILCAGKEEVFEFIGNVLDEVCELFPSEYIHIGGDEASKTRWQNCDDCQKRIREENLKDEHELQSYFIKRVEKMLQLRGKKLIGWDEILEGGLAENAAVMSWRGVQGGIAAARAGHQVVMSPTSHCYFDYSYHTTSVEKVYSFNPLPDELSAEESAFVLGAQGNFWSHIDRTAASMQRQIFPRIIALSEALWTEPSQKNYEDFSVRLDAHYSYLDSSRIAYYSPDQIAQPIDSTDIISKLNLEAYSFDFHGYQGMNFNYRGMACRIVQPDSAAEGKPWIWRARFWGHEPQLDIALLERGYHVVWCDVGKLFGNQEAVDRFDRFYALMQKGGLAHKAVLEGMSRGGLIIYNWAVQNADKVACIYADAPVLDGTSWPGGFGTGKGSKPGWERFKMAYQINTRADSVRFAGDPIHQAVAIAKTRIPLIHVCGEADHVVPIAENTNPFEKIILANGGTIKVIRKPGVDHHPHSLKDPTVILDFILAH